MKFGLYTAEGNKTSDISYFYGLNRTRRPKRGEFADMKNMSSCEYPCIAPRGRRDRVASASGTINAITAPDAENTGQISGLTGVADDAFWYNGVKKSGRHSLGADYKWEIIRKGNLYIINGFRKRDKKYDTLMYYYNIDTDVFDLSVAPMDNLILCAGSDGTGDYISTFRYGFDAVREYTAVSPDGTVIANQDFFDTYANGGRVLPQENIFEKRFSAGEEISIKGFPTETENFGQVWSYSTTQAEVVPQTNQDFSLNNTVDTDAYASLAELADNEITNAYVDSFDVDVMDVSGVTVYIHKMYLKLYNKNGDKIGFDNMKGAVNFYCSGISLQKRTRSFDNIALHHGRIWGTVPTGNMIYASSSDDIFSFSAEDILAKFAARITSDTAGAFTAICEYNDELVAFKENSITVVYGSGVSSYGTAVINGIGCIDKNSVQVTPEGVIFLSYGGFYIYSGGMPVCISHKLNTACTGAVSGFDGDVYYACVNDGGRHIVLAYDMRYGLWHSCDEINATGFFRFRDGFYVADSADIYRTDTGDFDGEWSFESVSLYENTLDNKALSEIWIRAEVSEGAGFKVETSVDGGAFRAHSEFKKSGHRIFRCPVRAVMGHNFRYRISGKGKVVFYELEFKNAGGGRRYKEYET